MIVERSFDAWAINSIINHPDVFPFVSLPGMGNIDLAEVIANPRNVLLMAEGGGLIFQDQGGGQYEVHIQFLPEVRGGKALQASREAASWMFTNTDCEIITARVPSGNFAASAMARKVGLRFQYIDRDAWRNAGGLIPVSWYALTKPDWQSQRKF